MSNNNACRLCSDCGRRFIGRMDGNTARCPECAAAAASTRAAQIQEERKNVLARRLALEVVATRVVSAGGRITTHHLVDLGREHGRGKCCWIPPLPAA